MIYTYKNYREVKSYNIKNFPINEVATALKNKSKLGNFVSQPNNLFSGKEIYGLKKELDFLKQFDIEDKSFIGFINAIDKAYEHIDFSLEFLDRNKNSDLFLFSLTEQSNYPSEKKNKTNIKTTKNLCLKIYELKRIAPLLLTEEDIENIFSEFDKWKYEKITNLLFYSQGILSNSEIAEIKEELEKIKEQQLVSSKAMQLVEFFLKTSKNTKIEEFMILERYISIYH